MEKNKYATFVDAYCLSEIKCTIMGVICSLVDDENVSREDAADKLVNVVDRLSELEADKMEKVLEELPQK